MLFTLTGLVSVKPLCDYSHNSGSTTCLSLFSRMRSYIITIALKSVMYSWYVRYLGLRHQFMV